MSGRVPKSIVEIGLLELVLGGDEFVGIGKFLGQFGLGFVEDENWVLLDLAKV